MLTELLSFVAGLGTGVGAMVALNTIRRAETQPIPPDWLPKVTTFPECPKPFEYGQRSPYAPKPRAQEPYIPKSGKPIPSARGDTRTRLPDIPWGKPHAK